MLLNSKWITYITGEYKDADAKYGNPSPYFRKEFCASGAVKKAEVLISALGVYQLYLNGAAVAGDYLSPGWVDYAQKLPLIVYDITDRIAEQNAIGVVLGDGWAVGHIGSNYTFKRNNYTDRLEFTLTVKITYEDGRVETVITDQSWKASAGEILRSDIYMGEFVDHRLSLGDFSTVGYDDSAWDAVEVPVFKFSRNLYLQKLDIPPVVVKHTFSPTVVSREHGKILYDVGQNMAGVLRCVFRGERGAKITLRHGEMLKDGALYTENLRKAKATDIYILSGDGDEEFRPLFTYHGFQYAEITIEGNAEVISVTAEAMYTDLTSTGHFSCSDEIVNKIFENALWGQRDNFMSVPTDCPQRDERLGWTGDSQVFCQTAMYNMDCDKYYRKYLADIREAQLGNGVIPGVAPMPQVGSYAYTGRDAAAGWSEAIGEIPYAHYKMYGDKSVLRDNLPALKRLLAYYEADSTDYLRDGGNMYGDWLSVGETSDLSVIANLYYAHAAWLAAWMSERLNDAEQAAQYTALFERIKTAFRAAYVDANGRILSDTQSVYVIGYRFGLIDAREARENLIRKLKDSDNHLTTGFLGVKYLLPVLCDLGLVDEAYDILTKRDYPGWGYSILNGATTIWEHWDSYTKEKGFLPGMNSFNHFSLGSCVEWMYEYCLGLRPDETVGGCRKMTFMPYFDGSGKITDACGHYDTAFGRIAVEWKRQGDSFVYTVSAPSAIDCSFVFPNGAAVSESHEGHIHTFTVDRN